MIIDQPLSGFDVLGTDDFSSEFSRYKKYLPYTYIMKKRLRMILIKVQNLFRM